MIENETAPAAPEEVTADGQDVTSGVAQQSAPNEEAPTEETAPAAEEEETPTNEETPDGVASEAEEDEEVAEATPVDPGTGYHFEGQEVLAVGEREMNGVTYKTVRLMDGSMHDVTDEEFDKMVDEAAA